MCLIRVWRYSRHLLIPRINARYSKMFRCGFERIWGSSRISKATKDRQSVPRVEILWVMPVSAGYNAFEPNDLELAQSVLDEVWASLPRDVRNGSRATLLRERLARQILFSMRHETIQPDELKVSVLRADIKEWASS
jgi:hypothetical protein